MLRPAGRPAGRFVEMDFEARAPVPGVVLGMMRAEVQRERLGKRAGKARGGGRRTWGGGREEPREERRRGATKWTDNGFLALRFFSINCCTPPHVVYSNFHESSTPAVYEAGEVPEIRHRTAHTRVGCVAVFHKTTITRNIVQTTCNGIIFSGVQLLIGCVEVAVLLVRSGSPVAGRQRIRFVGDRARGAGVHAAVKVAQAISFGT